jgi:hypothetical protein
MRLKLILVVAILVASCAAQQEVSNAESAYADWNDAVAALATIDSGYSSTYAARDREQWKKLADNSRLQLAQRLKKVGTSKLAAADVRAVTLMRAALASAPEASSELHCADAQRSDLELRHLRRALYACFSEIGDHLRFQEHEITRGAAMGKLEQSGDPQQRKALFFAMVPLYEAINGNDQGDSPYRRMITLAAAEKTSEITNAARTVGTTPGEVEKWLVEILDTWRKVTPQVEIEPWDYRFANGEAARELDPVITRELLISANDRYYRDLGADLKQLGIINDIEPRAGKSPVAYTDFAQRGRMINGKWRPTIARILASYPTGGLGNLNEFVHENGHAVQISAIRTRPAFMDWGDTLWVEAFADVSSWNTYDSAWQQKYLGTSASLPANLRNLYAGVMLDVAWALFEIRMLKAPSGDPNVVWTDITHTYLHIVSHPELSWWAIRGQLVDAPGYMVNYGLGAVLTAGMRARVRQQIGLFNTGNPRWYPWLTQHLLRFGTERETSDLLRDFLGRPVSPQALLEDLGRLSP